jgi:methylglutaconyl-CoA hydratase
VAHSDEDIPGLVGEKRAPQQRGYSLSQPLINMEANILIERQGSLGIITLNRAERHNAFDDTLIADLSRAFKQLDSDVSVRVVVLSAAGKSFSAGADLNWMKRMAAYSVEENVKDARGLAELMRTIDCMSKPTIARVQGAAFGGGVGLVACCDIAVGLTSAQFSLSEVKLGLIPAVISPYVIAAIGKRAARRYFLTAERFDAAEAYRLGLLHDLATNEEQLDERLNEIVEALLVASPAAVTASKALIAAVGDRPLTYSLIEDTAERIALIRASDEGKEGVAAFLEKRKPNWIIEG